MKYLSVGTNHLYNDLTSNIKNSTRSKPTGGIWATIQDENNLNFNPWVEYFNDSEHTYYLYQKYSKNSTDLPAVLITLKEDANIFYLNNEENLLYALENYPNGNNWIDFEALSKDYDGIYIDIYLKTTNSKIKYYITEKLIDFSISSLILFNLKPILYYNEAMVRINELDVWSSEWFNYKIEIDDEKKYILPPKEEINILCNKICEYIKKNNLMSGFDYNEKIGEVFKEELKNAISLLEENDKTRDSEELEMLLIRRVLRSI